MMFDIKKIQWPGWETIRLIESGNFSSVYEIRRKTIDGNEEISAMKVISIPQSDYEIKEMRNEGYDEEAIKTIYKEQPELIVKEYSILKKMNRNKNFVRCEDFQFVKHEDGFGWDVFIKMDLLTPLTKHFQKILMMNV